MSALGIEKKSVTNSLASLEVVSKMDWIANVDMGARYSRICTTLARVTARKGTNDRMRNPTPSTPGRNITGSVNRVSSSSERSMSERGNQRSVAPNEINPVNKEKPAKKR